MTDESTSDRRVPSRRRTGLVLSGGGARGAYEAGVLSYLFEHVYDELGPGFEFDIVAGTSVGAIHAAQVAATADMPGADRARALREVWSSMALHHVLRVSPRDLVEVPLRALGMEQLVRSVSGSSPELLGGLVDISPLEHLVDTGVAWGTLRRNLRACRPGALAVSCTEIVSGRITVFLDGPSVDHTPWEHDPFTVAVRTAIGSRHVRASAAIPFLFPAVRIDEKWYLDGGLRVNTPLSPALRLGADKLVIVALRCSPEASEPAVPGIEKAISQPAFLLGKLLNVLMLDQLETELRRLEMLNALIGASEGGSGCLERMHAIARARRGAEYRKVDHVVIRPSCDIGALAAEAYSRRGGMQFSGGLLAFLLARAALFGVPEREADLLSYIYFDASFTRPLFELGREDAARSRDDLLALLAAPRADESRSDRVSPRGVGYRAPEEPR